LCLALILDRTVESADSAFINVINRSSSVNCAVGGEAFPSTSSITATPLQSAGTAEPAGAAELVMGRKKIQITQIADERNRQVKSSSLAIHSFHTDTGTHLFR